MWKARTHLFRKLVDMGTVFWLTCDQAVLQPAGSVSASKVFAEELQSGAERMGRGRFEFGARDICDCHVSWTEGHLLKNFPSRIPCPCALSSFLFILYPAGKPANGLQDLSLEITTFWKENGNAQAQEKVFSLWTDLLRFFPFTPVSKCINDWNWHGNREVSFGQDVKSLFDNKVGKDVCVSCPTINASPCSIYSTSYHRIL